MEVLILDDLKSRKTKLVEMLEKRRYKWCNAARATIS